MNASSWSLRNLPWFKATLAQWRYALRNTIAMCVLIHLKYEKKPGGHWIIRDLMGLDLVGLASL